MSPNLSSGSGRLQGQVVIVTGGTGGIGLATCQAVARAGAAVVVVDLNPERVAAVAAELPRATAPTTDHLGFPLDVRDEEGTQRLAEATLKRFGRIDALVACAGILRLRGTAPKPVVQTTTAEWDQVLDVNLKGVFLSNRAVLPAMMQQRSGTILNVSSVSGLKGRAHDAPYCASKFGVIGLSQALADEVRGYGIRVQALMPDSIDTPFWEQNHPVPRPGQVLPPERVAEVVVFMLALPADTMVLGAVIAPTGARRRKASAPPGGTAGAAVEGTTSS